MMDLSREASVVACMVLFLVLVPGRSMGRQLQFFSLADYMVEKMFLDCDMSPEDLNEIMNNLHFPPSEGMTEVSKQIYAKTRSLTESKDEDLNPLSLHLKLYLECLRKQNHPASYSGKGNDLKNWCSFYLDSLLGWYPASRRNLASQHITVTPSEPEQVISHIHVSTPTNDPVPSSIDTSDTTTDATDKKKQESSANPYTNPTIVQNNQEDINKIIAVAVVLSVSGTSFVAIIVFIIYYKCRKNKVFSSNRSRDDRPLLLSLSNISGSSQNSYGIADMNEKNKLGVLSLNAGSVHGDASSLNVVSEVPTSKLYSEFSNSMLDLSSVLTDKPSEEPTLAPNPHPPPPPPPPPKPPLPVRPPYRPRPLHPPYPPHPPQPPHTQPLHPPHPPHPPQPPHTQPLHPPHPPQHPQPSYSHQPPTPPPPPTMAPYISNVTPHAPAPPPPPPNKTTSAPPPPPSTAAPPPPPVAAPPPPPSKPGAPRPPQLNPGSARVPRPAPLGPKPPGTSDGPPKTKLKPFFWDKVAANSDQAMVWNQIKAGSFQFDEEMIESLFGYAGANKRKNDGKESACRSPAQYVRILDAKKSQNLAISLKALNVKIEVVQEALMEGKELPSELVQTLLKMAPTVDEELRLRLYTGNTSELALAEQFLKALLDIPFAFQRLEAVLFMMSMPEDYSSAKESFSTVEVACQELKNSRLFLKLLEAVLKTGNRMNDGTFRGGAQAFKLDTLLKLADVKGADGKTTLMHFVVQEIIRSEGARAVRLARQRSARTGNISTLNVIGITDGPPSESEDYYRKLGLKIVSGLGDELQNVKKAAFVDSDALINLVASLGHSLLKTKEFLTTNMKSQDEDSGFHRKLKDFVENSEIKITLLLEEEKKIRSMVKETTDFFHGNSTKDEGLRLFVIVRDYLVMLDKACKEVREAPRTVKQPPPQNKDITLPTVPDPKQLLFPAIRDRRVDSSSSSSSSDSDDD